MTGTLNRRGFLHAAAATGSFLACYGVADPAQAAEIRIAAPVIDKLTIQVLLDGAHDIFISGTGTPDVGSNGSAPPPHSTEEHCKASGACPCTSLRPKALKRNVSCWISASREMR